MDIADLGIDLGKMVCSLAGIDGTGAVVPYRRLQLLRYPAHLPPCVVAMQACSGADPLRVVNAEITPRAILQRSRHSTVA